MLAAEETSGAQAAGAPPQPARQLTVDELIQSLQVSSDSYPTTTSNCKVHIAIC
jgi:hypothetical protein